MNETGRIAGITAGIALLLGAGGYWYYRTEISKPEPVPVAATPEETPAAPEPAVPAEAEYPVPVTPAAASEPAPPALPALADSDGIAQEALGSLFGAEPVEAFLLPENRIRHLVVTIDNLTAERMPMQERVVRRVFGLFQVDAAEGGTRRSSANDARYAPLASAFNSADPAQLARLYFRYYPLFEKAYHELGYPEAHFNDRLVQVIDHLLATPEVDDAVLLVQPKVFYQFADPKLEALSSGQKTLIRLGSVHRSTVKAKLRALRVAIATGKRKPALS